MATAYQKISKEEALQDTNDIKKHWIKNLCNNMKKPTGATGENGDRVNRCMKTEKKIMQKTKPPLFESDGKGRFSGRGGGRPSPPPPGQGSKSRREEETGITTDSTVCSISKI